MDYSSVEFIKDVREVCGMIYDATNGILQERPAELIELEIYKSLIGTKPQKLELQGLLDRLVEYNENEIVYVQKPGTVVEVAEHCDDVVMILLRINKIVTPLIYKKNLEAMKFRKHLYRSSISEFVGALEQLQAFIDIL